jgi:hypothetical protein
MRPTTSTARIPTIQGHAFLFWIGGGNDPGGW